MIRRVIALLFILVLGTPATAGRVENMFEGGVLGVPWGTPLDDVVGMYPQGDHVFAVTPGCRAYWVRDGQTFMGVPRERNGVLFGFDKNNRVTIVAVAFSYERKDELRAALTGLLGPPWQKPKGTPTTTYGWGLGDEMIAAVTEFGVGDQRIIWLSIAPPGYKPTKQAC